MTYLVAGVVYGFLAAALMHGVLHNLLRFHAEWRGLVLSCLLTALVCMIAMLGSFIVYDAGEDFFLFKVVSTTFLSAFAAGTGSFRFIIRSETGRYFNTFTSALAALCFVVPPTALGIFVHQILNAD